MIEIAIVIMFTLISIVFAVAAKMILDKLNKIQKTLDETLRIADEINDRRR